MTSAIFIWLHLETSPQACSAIYKLLSQLNVFLKAIETLPVNWYLKLATISKPVKTLIRQSDRLGHYF